MVELLEGLNKVDVVGGDMILERGVGRQLDFRTVIALGHVLVLSASGGTGDLFLAAYSASEGVLFLAEHSDTLVASDADDVVEVDDAHWVLQVHDLVARHMEGAVVREEVRIDQIVVLQNFSVEDLFHPDLLVNWDNLG